MEFSILLIFVVVCGAGIAEGIPAPDLLLSAGVSSSSRKSSSSSPGVPAIRERVAVPPMCYWNASLCDPLIPPEVRARIRAVLERDVLDLDMAGIGEGLAHACWLLLGFPSVDECIPCSALLSCAPNFEVDAEACNLYCPKDASSDTQATTNVSTSKQESPGLKTTIKTMETETYFLIPQMSSHYSGKPNSTNVIGRKTTNRQHQLLRMGERAFGPWSTEDSPASNQSAASSNPDSSSFSVNPSGSILRARVPERGGILMITAQLTVYARRPVAVHLVIDGAIVSTCRLHGLGRSEQCSLTYLTPVRPDASSAQTSLSEGARNARGQAQVQASEHYASVALLASRRGLVVDARAQLTRLSLTLWN